MSKELSWYWHRLRAMGLGEVMAHARKKWRQRIDGRSGWTPPTVELEQGRGFPKLPEREAAPLGLGGFLRKEAAEVQAGRWRAFGHLPLQVDLPPRWHKDYLAGCDLVTDRSAFQLNHRSLPGGGDVKLIWELSRWAALVRLAQHAWLNEDEAASRTCLRWLEDWTKHNPPWVGWNWTSALESGLRLVQLSWLDALVGGADHPWNRSWANLRVCLLPAHVWFTWRYRSCGSSANNHLLGEIVGTLLAVARWPALAPWAAPLDVLQNAWEEQTLAQFAEDGGNREQALNYHLFSFEFCWQARTALEAAGRQVSPRVEERLQRAAAFFLAVQEPAEPWDYGDSDNGFVTPLFRSERTIAQEWVDWLRGRCGQPLDFWLGSAPFRIPFPSEGWQQFPESGQAVLRERDWFLRLDVSPLGYLATAAHGHLDALHLSIWYRGLALVIDPGTGAYYGDAELRGYLAGRSAHNGPNPEGRELAARLGPFLWGRAHARPRWELLPDQSAQAELQIARGLLRRRVEPYRQVGRVGWRVIDEFQCGDQPPGAFTVRWQFAPDAALEPVGEHAYLLRRHGACLQVVAEPGWESATAVTRSGSGDWRGTVSPGFREQQFAPCLDLRALGGGSYSTLFLVAAP